MRRGGGQGHRIMRCLSPAPGGGKDPRLRPPLPCAHDQILGVCFREGSHQGAYPPQSHLSCDLKGPEGAWATVPLPRTG